MANHKESTRFYASILHKESDGTWGIYIKPSMGQDEAGGVMKRITCAPCSVQSTV